MSSENGHISTNEWINKCDACSLVLMHISRIINFFTVWLSLQKKPSVQIKEILWNWLLSRVTDRPKPHGLIRHTMVWCRRQRWAWWHHVVPSLKLFTHGETSLSSFSPFSKFTHLWPWCSSSGRDQSPNPHFVTLLKPEWLPGEMKSRE